MTSKENVQLIYLGSIMTTLIIVVRSVTSASPSWIPLIGLLTQQWVAFSYHGLFHRRCRPFFCEAAAAATGTDGSPNVAVLLVLGPRLQHTSLQHLWKNQKSQLEAQEVERVIVDHMGPGQ